MTQVNLFNRLGERAFHVLFNELRLPGIVLASYLTEDWVDILNKVDNEQLLESTGQGNLQGTSRSTRKRTFQGEEYHALGQEDNIDTRFLPNGGMSFTKNSRSGSGFSSQYTYPNDFNMSIAISLNALRESTAI